MVEILIVEDGDSMRHLLEHVVGGITGFRVSGTARNGWEARLELSRRRPSLVLLDEILPGESSLDLLQDFSAQGIPVILITSVAEPDHECPAEALGRVSKPGWKSAEADRQRLANSIRTMMAAVRLDT